MKRPAPCCPPEPVGPGDPGGDHAPRVALVGNPNVGKSTLFNALTGAQQHVGNWPGKTVQVASGSWSTPDGPIELMDLPGTYSLVARSPDEELVRDLIADPATARRPDLVVAVLDAANLPRSLYLLGQIRDTGTRLVVALTMMDIADGRGVRVDPRALSARLGVPVIPVQPRRRDGLAELTSTALATLERPAAPVAGLAELMAEPDDEAQIALAEERYDWVHDVVTASVRRTDPDRATVADRADRLLTSRWLGLPIFFMVMWAVLVATTLLAAPLQDGLSQLVDGPIRDVVAWLLARVRLDDTWLAGLVLNGLVSGVGQVLTFVPLMAIMFVLLTVLEDSGYLARAAFVADRFLRMVGLPGRAFLPLLVGFGCNVPAISATRILPDARHRVLTSLLVPFVTCSARLTVYLLLANVFFGQHAGTVVFGMYLLSIGLIIGAGLALRHTVFRHQPREALLLELPPYRRPTVRVVVRLTWQKLAGFLRTASGVIVATVAAVWLMTAIPLSGGDFGNVDPGDSLYGGVSSALSPVFAPAGFADWHATGALITGFVAKEAVVSTFAQTYATAEPDDVQQAGTLGDELRITFERTSGGHPAAAALAFLVFLLAYTPCMATVAAQRAEIGARWTWVGMAMQFAIAWSLATAVFQIGRWLT